MLRTREFDLEWFNSEKIKLGEQPIELETTQYSYINNCGTAGDKYAKYIFDDILQNGAIDHNPRPYYEDIYDNATLFDKGGEKRIILPDKDIILSKKDIVIPDENKIIVHSPAHTISTNNEYKCSYDLSKGESPMMTLRPIAFRTSIAEIIWIYFMKSNDLVEFDELLGKNTWDKDHKINNWWEKWALRDANGNYILNKKGHPIIGSTYGEVIRKRNMFYREVIHRLKTDPDCRRIICSLWQVDDYRKPHGLKPCAFMTIWNVRHGRDGVDYLDMCLVQRSSDFCTAGCINQVQYAALLVLVAREVGLEPGVFTWNPVNVQIYDRHIEQSIEMLNRKPVKCEATIKLDPSVKSLKQATPDSITILSQKDKQKIKKINPQLDLPIAI